MISACMYASSVQSIKEEKYMSNYTDFINFTGDRNYERNFWDAMRGKSGAKERLSDTTPAPIKCPSQMKRSCRRL